MSLSSLSRVIMCVTTSWFLRATREVGELLAMLALRAFEDVRTRPCERASADRVACARDRASRE
jgi:hypothetical protein